MSTQSHKHHFRRFLDALGDRLHFAAHSHHLWPDVTLEAHGQAWLDAARLVDGKWEHVFGELWPRAQAHVARRIGLADGSSICFGPNVHDFLMRLLSCLEGPGPHRVLTTDAEFHSLRRQLARLEEAGRVRVTRVAAEPFGDFPARFAAALAAETYDLVYASHVFFDSGYVFDEVFELLAATPEPTLAVVDAYHGFLAVPTDLGAAAGRVFYTSGGYKYAMSGEGVCFLHAPPGLAQRPVDTGWFAGFAALESGFGDRVPYPSGGERFLGATFDPTGLYRFVAVGDLLDREGLTVERIHEHVRARQAEFLAGIERSRPLGLGAEQLLPDAAEARRGHFLTFRRPDAQALRQGLWDAGIVTDCRGDRLRFGFGIYHDAEDVAALLERLGRL